MSGWQIVPAPARLEMHLGGQGAAHVVLFAVEPGEKVSDLVQYAQVAAVPIALIMIALMVCFYIRGRERRALACHFDPIESPLEIKAGGALHGDIEIRYQGQPVENLFLVRGTLRNTGNMAIRETHVVEPVTFTFPDATILLNPRVVHTRPEDLGSHWDSSTVPNADGPDSVDTAQVYFQLMNPGDEVTIEFLTTGRSARPKVTARIEGVTRIERLDPEMLDLRAGLGWFLYAVGGVVAYAIALLMVHLIRGKGDWPTILVMIMACLAGILAGMGVALLTKYVRLKRR